MIVRNNLKLVLAMSLLGMHTAVMAFGDDRITMQGYGDTGYIQALDNDYVPRDNGRTWDYNYLSLNFTAKVDEKTKIVAQLRSGSEVDFDNGAFVQHNLTADLTLRAGQMKVPAGIYNDIRDIKFLQLSTLEPIMYRESTGTFPASFKGVSSIYHLDMGNHRVSFDVYGGEPAGSNVYDQLGYFTKNIAGGRITYKTPVGLKFSVSQLVSDMKYVFPAPGLFVNGVIPVDTAATGFGVKTLSMASIDYTRNDFDIKAEYATASETTSPAEVKGESYYAQIGYTFAKTITPFIRYDYVAYDVTQDTDPRVYQSSNVVGFSYKLNHSVSLRMENHWNKGYATAPIARDPAPVNPQEKWEIFAMGLNFVF